jgi:ketosteroid isomerase-like protein
MNKTITLILGMAVMALQGQQTEKEKIDQVLDSWHQAAAKARFQDYFDKMSEGAIFVGTDAAEHWDKAAFMSFSKPYFERGKAWAFTPLQRHVYLKKGGQVAWFDELLDTWMQLCRGSGVLVKERGEWKIAHYVLSLTIPNENVDGAIELKRERDSVLRSSLLLRQPN